MEPLGWGLGDVVRKLRKKRRMSIVKMRALAGLNKDTVGRLERGTHQSDRSTVEAVAKALAISAVDLYTYGEIMDAADRLAQMPSQQRVAALAVISRYADEGSLGLPEGRDPDHGGATESPARADEPARRDGP
jgi:transcriptional regulator with XRE-family HTH domain